MSERDKPSDNGKRIIGIKEVAAIGMASVIHHIAIHKVEAKTAIPSSERPLKLIKYRVITNSIGPKKKTYFFQIHFFKYEFFYLIIKKL